MLTPEMVTKTLTYMRVALTIDTMSSMSSFLEKILIEEAAVGKMGAVTSCKWKQLLYKV